METKKPQTMPVKDFLIRRMSIDTAISVEVITAVVTHQFVSMVEATKTVDSVELSGFGRFLFYKRKALRKLKWYEDGVEERLGQLLDPSITDKKRKGIEDSLEGLRSKIETLKKRLNET